MAFTEEKQKIPVKTQFKVLGYTFLYLFAHYQEKGVSINSYSDEITSEIYEKKTIR